MLKIEDFDYLDLTLLNGKITSFTDVLLAASLKAFHYRLTQRSIAKLYVVKENEAYLYVGTTFQSLTSRFRSGLNTDRRSGYHGYKFKDKEKIRIYAWCFESLNKMELENLEAELAFVIRQQIGKWPLKQNEIHFNNDYDDGKSIANKLFQLIEQ